MGSITFILLLTSVAPIHAEDSMDKSPDLLTDKLVNRFFDRPEGGAELDSTTLAKPRQATIPQRTSLVRATPPKQPTQFAWSRPLSSSVHADAPSSSSSSSASTSGSLTDVGRRALMLGMASVVGSLVQPTGTAQALQGYTAGRIPGLVTAPGKEGFNLYTRPEGKQGGHGVGWSEITPYSFLVPDSWDEIPVSIADLGGTELDLRFKDAKEGDLAVVVAPVLRFTDVGFNADVRLEQLGDPQKMIQGFGPEIMGRNIDDLLESSTSRSVDGLTYYDYELRGHVLISMTAVKNRVYIMTVRPKDSNQWRRHSEDFRTIQDSFRVA